jgi:hypothetical protein
MALAGLLGQRVTHVALVLFTIGGAQRPQTHLSVVGQGQAIVGETRRGGVRSRLASIAAALRGQSTLLTSVAVELGSCSEERVRVQVSHAFTTPADVPGRWRQTREPEQE